MRYRLLLVFFFIGHLAFGQTGGRIKVPGTRCSLVPPDGFVLATKFAGFMNAETGASIVINETLGSYVTTASELYTEKALTAKGNTFISRQRLDFNNSNGILIKVKETVSGITFFKQIFIFGNAKETVVITAHYAEKFKSLEGKLTDALLSTVYSSFEEANYLEAVKFTLNVDGSGFKAIGFVGSGLIYTIDGRVSAKSVSDTSVLVVGSSVSNVAGSDRKRFAEESLKKGNNLEVDKISEVTEITVDSLKGYEIVASTKTKALVYYTMLFEENGEYYFILGMGANSASKLETYRKIARTFKRK